MSTSWFEPLIIKAATDGDDVAARGLIRYLAVCLERGIVPPVEVCEYFAKALRRIADDDCSADAALSTDGKITGKSAIYARDCEIAREVWKLKYRTKNPLPFRDSNKSGAGAFSTVADQRSMTSANVERIYKEKRWLIKAEAFEMTLEPGEDREGPKVTEADQQALRRQFEVDQHIAFAQLAETIKKRGSY
ncbi:hypothetical protein [Pseudomonas migulae]